MARYLTKLFRSSYPETHQHRGKPLPRSLLTLAITRFVHHLSSPEIYVHFVLVHMHIFASRVIRWNRSVGISKKTYPVKHEVLSCETEVLETQLAFSNGLPSSKTRPTDVPSRFYATLLGARGRTNFGDPTKRCVGVESKHHPVRFVLFASDILGQMRCSLDSHCHRRSTLQSICSLADEFRTARTAAGRFIVTVVTKCGPRLTRTALHTCLNM